MNCDIAPAWVAILRQIRVSPGACVAPSALAAALAVEPDVMLDQLAEMDIAGWICVWETEGGPLITYSPLTVERLDLKLTEDARGTLRWVIEAEGTPERVYPRPCHDDGQVDVLDTIADPSPGPDEIAERNEAAERAGAALIARSDRYPLAAEDVPYPTVMLLGNESDWYEIDRRRGRKPAFRRCDCCKGRKLPLNHYCLRCSRWGWDPYFAAPKPCAAGARERKSA
jgi:hypothetical protein